MSATELEVRRFRQKVRAEIRGHVARTREAPMLTLWASEGSNPRRVQSLRVGAASSEAEVRARIVEGIRERRANFAAVGRVLRLRDEEGLHPTSVFGLVVVSPEGVECLEADVVAGRVGAWRESEIRTEGESSPAAAWFFVQQAVRAAARREDLT